MKQLIILPGIGDDHWAYHLSAGIFRLFGFTTHIHVFNWANPDPASYDERFSALETQITSLTGPVYLLGVSAGGPIAVTALGAHPDKIARVATLCSPLARFSYSVNPLLAVAIEHVVPVLNSMDPAIKQRILSIRGLHDGLVPLKLSQPAGVQTRVIPSFEHIISNFLGMTLFSYLIIRFFR